MFLFQAFGRSFWLAVIGSIAAISVTGTAFTEALSGDQSSKAATSATVIGAYSVTNVRYTLNTTTPTSIDNILFKIVAPVTQPTFVRARAVGASPGPAGTFYTCTLLLNGADYDATCLSAGLTVAAANEMTIVVSK